MLVRLLAQILASASLFKSPHEILFRFTFLKSLHLSSQLLCIFPLLRLTTELSFVSSGNGCITSCPYPLETAPHKAEAYQLIDCDCDCDCDVPT
ncbi:hypothetical protein C8R43DRAFT_456468 [Mycena crocata]|nr:hypothetical protein C8R43DRAFT_456468 [Mycena crocata]